MGLILWLYIEKLFWELAEISLHEAICDVCSNAESRFGCAIFPRTLSSVLWLFTSCVWDVLRYRILEKTAFDFFRNVVSVVLYCVQLFWWFSQKPFKKYWTISPKQNTKFPKRRWVRPKKFFLSAALLFSLVVTKKIVLRTSWDLSTWNNTCSLFKFRVAFWQR